MYNGTMRLGQATPTRQNLGRRRYQRKYALLPRRTINGTWVWLERYYEVWRCARRWSAEIGTLYEYLWVFQGRFTVDQLAEYEGDND